MSRGTTPSRVLCAAVVLGSLLAAAVAPGVRGSASSGSAAGQWLQSVRSTLVCPEVAVPQGSATVVSGVVVAPITGVPAPNVDEDASAGLQMLDSGEELVALESAGEPVNVLLWRRSSTPIALSATGSWAGSALAGAVTRELSGAAAGLASTSCLAPRAEWWFLGAGSEVGRSSALLLSNAADEPASVDITLSAVSGPVEALAGKGVTLGPRSHVRLRLDAIGEGNELLGVRVRATSGRVAAALRDVAEPSRDRPRGVEYLPPAAAPDTRLWITGIPADVPSRSLLLLNPGGGFATVSARLITESGTEDVPGLATVAVPAGSVLRTPLDDVLGDRSGTLVITSDSPVTASVRVGVGTAAAQDVIWLPATPPVGLPQILAGAAAVAGGSGIATEVTVAAPDGEVRGFLEIQASGKSEEAILGQDGQLGSGELSERRGERTADPGPEVLDNEVEQVALVPVTVAAGTQSTLHVPTDDGGVLNLIWHCAAGSAPALLSHVTIGSDPVLATGYPWWPVESYVPAAGVREDIGTLVPVDQRGG